MLMFDGSSSPSRSPPFSVVAPFPAAFREGRLGGADGRDMTRCRESGLISLPTSASSSSGCGEDDDVRDDKGSGGDDGDDDEDDDEEDE